MTHLRNLLMVGMFCTILLSGTAINAEENNGVETPNVSAPGQTVAYEQTDGSQDINTESINNQGKIYVDILLGNGYAREYDIVNNGIPTGQTLDGKIQYDATTKTLTLDNVQNSGNLYFYNMGDVTIKLVGDNSFEGECKIYGYQTNITIDGNGSLTFDNSNTISDASAIWSDYLTINSGNINCKSYDIRGTKGITINGGSINLYLGSIITGVQSSDFSKNPVVDNNSQFIVNGGKTNIENYIYNDITAGSFIMNSGSINIDHGSGINTNVTTINGGSISINDMCNASIIANSSLTIEGGKTDLNTYTGIATISSPSISINPNLTIQAGDTLTKVGTYNNEARVIISGESKPVDDVITGDVMYRTHVQYIGWQGWKNESNISGTSGQSLRLEAIDIKLNNQDNLGIRYKTHVQNIGWQDWVYDGTSSGTTGKGLRLEAIAIELTGANADNYDVYYCVHAENFGWMSWAKNGEDAGTAGYSYRLEAIKIIVQPKGTAAPADLSSLPAFAQN